MQNPHPSLIKLKPPKLGKEALHGPIGECVLKLRPTIEAHHSAILLPLLVGMGSIFGRQPYFHVNRSIHHTNLFGLEVGGTSSGKKEALDAANWVLELVDPEWYNHCVKRSAIASGPGLWYCFRDPTAKDTGVTDKRIQFEEQEFGRVLALINTQGSTIGPVFREMWDSPTFKDHETRKDRFSVTNPHGSIMAHITPEEFRNLLAEIERYSGSINRFLLFYNRRVRSLPDPPIPQASDYQGIIHNLQKAVKMVRGDWKLNEVILADTFRMTRSQEATAFWLGHYDNLKFPKERPDIASVLAKGAPYVLRLSMIYALCDCSATIEIVHIKAALAVWLYCGQTVRFLFGPERLSIKAQKLLESLNMNGKLTLSDVENDVFQKNLKGWEAKEIIEELVEAGFAEMSQARSEGAKKDTTIIRRV